MLVSLLPPLAEPDQDEILLSSTSRPCRTSSSEVLVPQPLEQEIAREGAAGMAQQDLEQVHLATAEVER